MKTQGEMVMYYKDFDGRNMEKKHLDMAYVHKLLYPRARQIWYIKLWVNIGFEADGKWEYTRPVLVIKKIWSLFRCIPMTTKHKDNYYHYKLQTVYFWPDIVSSLMLSQARIIDIKRFEEMIGYVSEWEFQNIKKLLQDMYL
jgi:mRNA-degrading endonuclease toxin of MazEF toxin-antitoxin module